MRRKSRLRSAVALGSAFAVVSTGVALADGVVADGDGAISGASNTNLAFGDVCLGETATREVPVFVTRGSADEANNNNTFKDGSEPVVTQHAISGAGLSQSVPTGANGIQLPGDWSTQRGGTFSGSYKRDGSLTGGYVLSTVSLAAPSTGTGEYSGSITYRVTGSNNANNANNAKEIYRDDVLGVSATFKSCSTSVVKQDQTITFTQPTTPVQYGDSFTVSPTSSSGLPVTLAASGGCTALAGENGYDVNVTSGTTDCTLTASQPGDASYNAAASAVRTVGAARRSITVTADAKSKTYGDEDPALTHEVTSGNLVNGDTLSGSLVRATGESATTYRISQGTVSASSNYNLTYVPANLTINPRPITVTADAKSKIFGETDPALTYGITSGNLVGSDQLTGSLTRASGEAVGTYAIQQGSLSAGSNYNLSFVGRDLTIGAWTLEGFHAPIGASNSILQAPGGAVPQATTYTQWQVAKGGSTIPLKFNALAGSVERKSTSDVKSFGAKLLSGCSASSTNDPVEEFSSDSKTSLRYDTTDGQFIQNWKTSTVSGDTCYRVTVTLLDNSAIHTFVKLRK
jgi:hypothetical protein